MDVSYKLRATVALPPGKGLLITFGYEVELAAEPI
jgi:hypothetical protein